MIEFWFGFAYQESADPFTLSLKFETVLSYVS